ncbi:hypothetical protein PR003_g5418 [Phytophthora rubi]|uniref:RxLR effector protein n=1 Tax=Phytophthora rubi TaxID=129364 RepID=A0A6A4FSH7_9STRA|nr:hypothetical protein PR002_g5616 [Phytophthora rubi]KAE9044969.1 hypothetical protein PR001_g5163 [Phytophthora rubi]KAE9350343.1 hypothetical protein PR003_g5418 [Phytophthora rubi]
MILRGCMALLCAQSMASWHSVAGFAPLTSASRLEAQPINGVSGVDAFAAWIDC